MKSWIYHLNKIQAIREAERRNLDTSGTIDDIRRRLSRYIDEHPAMPETEPKTAMHGEGTGLRSALRLQIPPPSPLPPPPPEPTESHIAHGKCMNQIRKWGCHFDGRDPLSFLERVAELQRQYRYSDDIMVDGIPELLRGKALAWYRNFQEEWRTFDDFLRAFRRQYLPRRYQTRLTRDIQDRRQRPDEPFADYASDMLTMMRRAGNFGADAKLDRIYENMRAEYKYSIRLDDLTDLADLTDRAADFEEIRREEAREKQAARKVVSSAKPTGEYDRANTCWRCKQRGHDRFNCRRPAKIFCSQCGKDNVRTKDCHPRPGNAAAAGVTEVEPRPETAST